MLNITKRKMFLGIFITFWITLIISYILFGIVGRKVYEKNTVKEAIESEKLADGGTLIKVYGKEYVLDEKEQVLVEKLILQLRDKESYADKSTNIEQGEIEEICADLGI